MENEFFRNSTNSWVAPLPFRNPWQYLPNNRARIKEYWYLPFFGVYHPQKHNQIHVVCDSRAKFNGVSLNVVNFIRKVAQEGQDEFGTDVCHFIERDFYMDDALKSFPAVEKAIDILTRTQRMLSALNLKLHKLTSSKAEVLDAFPVEDWAKDLQNLNLLFDPLGFLAPITIQGRQLLREMMVQGSDWDSSLLKSFKGRWMDWQNSLHSLADICVPRTYSLMSLSKAELELCAAVMAVEIAEVITKEIKMEFNSISFYTDSKVVLVYIHNQSQRFYIYVNNRVQRIKKFTKPEQWHYVPSDENPADHGSRSVPASKLLTTTWLTGPPFLHGELSWAPEEQISFELVHPDDDKEIRPEQRLVNVLVGISAKTVFLWILWKEQKEKLIKVCSRNYVLRNLGASKAGYKAKEKNPVIIPGGDHISTLLKRHYHERVQHQGRHFTEGAVRASGLWIVRGRRLISKVLNQCVTCRRLQGKVKEQQMSDLPAERLQVDPPFSYVGMDMFRPWEVSARHTRGGHASSYRWAVLFTCLSTGAVHIEVVEEMSSSSFINALKCFFSLHGPAKQLRSDCGTNFIGACNEMGISIPGKDSVQKFLRDQKCIWIFNPPHSSHMGGVWECMIGVAQHILDGMFLQAGRARLTHEVLTALFAEVTAIMNARPLIPVSSDPENPYILTPSMLLTQKTGTLQHMLKCQWKHVQVLADEFWYRWRREYLGTLQCRKQWPQKEPDIK
ncbi:hypothetical protein M9458_052603 [Cirrhinus mrigala]|uniref:DUF5641 domain-containing protein n=1 Tax=Cirrhinus mrigala TaxID=683832 RepID=A0ABD0MT15_CIRMR